MDFDDLAPGQAVLVDWSEDRYHADTECVSNSWLSTLINEGPSVYRAKRDGVIGGDRSDALTFGTNVHLALLEPEEWRRRLYPPEPEKPALADGRRKKGSPEREAYEQWKAECKTWLMGLRDLPDAIQISEDDLARVEGCVAAVREDIDSAEILASITATEQTIIRRDEETGILLRHRLDAIADLGIRVIPDLKTTADPMAGEPGPEGWDWDQPGPFGWSVYRYGYHRQAAMYVDALAAVEPGAEIHFVIIAVRSRAPFEVTCNVIEAEELEQGRREYRRALRDLARRRAENDWLAPPQRGLNRIRLPRRAYDKDT